MKISKSFSLVSFFIYGLIMILLCGSCKTTSKSDRSRANKEKAPSKIVPDEITKSEDIDGLLSKLSGRFVATGMTEDSVEYEMVRYATPIWLTKEGDYLYVEQGSSDTPAQPEQQRIYKVLKDNSGGFEIKVYTLVEPEKFVGKWAEPEFFWPLNESIMEAEVGCSIYLIQHGDGSFSGSTRMDHCKNSTDGAAYLSSTLKIREDNIRIWDQGFNAAKQQVWGLKMLGYQFVRTKK